MSTYYHHDKNEWLLMRFKSIVQVALQHIKPSKCHREPYNKLYSQIINQTNIDEANKKLKEMIDNHAPTDEIDEMINCIAYLNYLMLKKNITKEATRNNIEQIITQFRQKMDSEGGYEPPPKYSKDTYRTKDHDNEGDDVPATIHYLHTTGKILNNYIKQWENIYLERTGFK